MGISINITIRNSEVTIGWNIDRGFEYERTNHIQIENNFRFDVFTIGILGFYLQIAEVYLND